MSSSVRTRPPAPTAEKRLVDLLGPAFVAAVAYVDPGNVAANLTAGAQFGYLLVWVLVVANIMAVLIQYLSAKLGIATGKSLPQILGERLHKGPRLLFWAQAQIVAIATDLAEVVGGAVALHLLFGLPLFLGGCIVGAVSLALLLFQSRRRQRTFEFVIMGLLLIITIGFLAGLVVTGPDWGKTAQGLIPRFEGTQTVLLAASMLGATVMPHAIYLHSSLARDRHGKASQAAIPRLIKATRIDVVISLIVAGGVNIGMLLLAATALAGKDGTDSIEGAHAAITAALGPAVGLTFAIGLLASGLASTSVGAYAGAEIMAGLLKVRVPLLVQRLITLAPSLLIIGLGFDPTRSLVVSQVVLSLGIPFALIPLALYTGRASVMGSLSNSRTVKVAIWLVAALIMMLNAALVILTLSGRA
ncbi:MAG: Nramp family divalent metal transporter [Galactobacter sp.]